MIISQTPLRITLGGGGSDLAENPLCITAAIQFYVYVLVNTNTSNIYNLRYSSNEQVHTIPEVKHTLFRSCLEEINAKPGLEIVSVADIDSNSGLGSSGAFTIGLLRALQPHKTLQSIVSQACKLDTGLQDQHAAAYGGLRAWTFDSPEPPQSLSVPLWADSWYLYDTGLRRDASETLRTNRRPSQTLLRAQATEMLEILHSGTPQEFGEALTAQWQAKLRTAPTETHLHIDRQINTLLSDGAYGAKLIGAGDGGMILACQKTPSQGATSIRISSHGTRILQ